MVLVLVVGSVATSATQKSYDGYQVLRLPTGSQLPHIQKKLNGLIFDQWNHDVERYLDIALPPTEISKFKSLGLKSRVMHHNLGDSIKAEQKTKRVWKRDIADLSWFDSYHAYDAHIQYFKDLNIVFPNNSEVFSSGTSYEGRDISGLHFWGSEGPGKPSILYHAGVHAREWITTPVVEYIAQKLITGYKDGDLLIQTLLDRYDFYFIPFVNPDGFVYTQTTERLWRKNRQPGPKNSTCYGRDINRNWEFGWDANKGGASTNPCSYDYKGEAPSDAPETQGLDSLVRKLKANSGIELFVDWHSYGQYILSPYGYNETLYAPELAKWTRAASYISREIRDSSTAGATYTFGPCGATLYRTTGSATDHIYAIGGADFSYTIELGDTGHYGFVLPPDQIRRVVEEQWAGQKLLFSLLDQAFFEMSDGLGSDVLST
ncbi:zinc carboxypeptidase [Aaosphaeria arxii CBS 175.79]|uniref:Zinc carboxypeptidase n=1 Tax=Aaosphaeria arxii CBS 175.79 TaxID=1450172 RepID=A0A6A5XIL9_9PLEO|nr:zinc carboxypeptidase [Aaosphaeria arxii CBS 175.79]KAF2013125.1 zinc carboxypeptidase [Aaosphaeria arxii CBS 175.79]